MVLSKWSAGNMQNIQQPFFVAYFYCGRHSRQKPMDVGYCFCSTEMWSTLRKSNMALEKTSAFTRFSLVVWNMAVMTFHILGMSWSQLTKSIIFQRGEEKPPNSRWWSHYCRTFIYRGFPLAIFGSTGWICFSIWTEAPETRIFASTDFGQCLKLKKNESEQKIYIPTRWGPWFDVFFPLVGWVKEGSGSPLSTAT